MARTKTTTKLNLDTLDTRDMLSATSVVLGADGVLNITCDNTRSSVRVSPTAGPSIDPVGPAGGGAYVDVYEYYNGRDWKFPTAKVKSIHFQGGAGNDSFSDTFPAIPVVASGGAGDDYLQGSGRDDS